ncbi:MAG TPA: HAMP domain-containing sensor histidine kinase, partial [Kofleriaceae bacterium]|nr:HAMP domain-containing sensor histidine kinase [Kofleriaceae bacterium]
KGPPLSRDQVALAPIVKHVVDTLHARATEVGGTLTTEVADDVKLRGDEDAIERVVLNLADNALRYGGKDVRVSIAARKEGDIVFVSVSDTGPGIPEEHRAKIFDRFHRGNTTQEGSGLGLAIARELAIAMGGTLTLSGASRFTLELPA